jgi:hypothetical protein
LPRSPTLLRFISRAEGGRPGIGMAVAVSLGAPKPGGDLDYLGRGLGPGPGCLEPNLSELVAWRG